MEDIKQENKIFTYFLIPILVLNHLLIFIGFNFLKHNIQIFSNNPVLFFMPVFFISSLGIIIFKTIKVIRQLGDSTFNYFFRDGNHFRYMNKIVFFCIVISPLFFTIWFWITWPNTGKTHLTGLDLPFLIMFFLFLSSTFLFFYSMDINILKREIISRISTANFISGVRVQIDEIKNFSIDRSEFITKRGKQYAFDLNVITITGDKKILFCSNNENETKTVGNELIQIIKNNFHTNLIEQEIKYESEDIKAS